MIRPLRKYHYWSWRIIALVMPLLFVLSILSRPEQGITNFSDNNFEFKSVENDSLILISIKINQSMHAASCSVYANGNDGQVFLGFIAPEKNFSFHVALTTHSISVFDTIRKREIKEFKIEHQP